MFFQQTKMDTLTQVSTFMSIKQLNKERQPLVANFTNPS